MADYAKDIKEILDIVRNIEIQNATRDAEIKSIGELAQKNYTCLEGNGKKGLKADVEQLQGVIKIVIWVGGIVGTAMIAYILNTILHIP